jgi:error-prone DNA polymerase
MGFYSGHTLLHDGMRHGVKVAGIDATQSDWDNRLVRPMHLRLGFREIRGLREAVGRALEKARGEKAFTGFTDFLNRTSAALRPVPLTKRDLFLLAGAKAFECFGLDRRQAFWNIQALALEESYAFNPADEPVALPRESEWETITGDYESQGVSINTHPMAYFRADLEASKVACSRSLAHLPEGKRVKVAGISICRQQPPTASGVLFITLEDEYGFINLVVWKKVLELYRPPLLTQSFLLCEGRIQRAMGTNVLHVIVDRASPLLHPESPAPPLPSHDFR